MLDEKLQSKIDLLQEQIDNLEKSGFFTEKEMDSFSSPFRMELAVLKSALVMRNLSNAARTANHEVGTFVSKFNNKLNSIPNKYGMSDEEYEEAKIRHNRLFAPVKVMSIEVVDAEILTLNHQEA